MDGVNGYNGSLTNRERSVLEHLVEGATNYEIGKKLFISEKTVKAHMASLMRKLQVRNRTELAVLVVRYGILEPAPITVNQALEMRRLLDEFVEDAVRLRDSHGTLAPSAVPYGQRPGERGHIQTPTVGSEATA